METSPIQPRHRTDGVPLDRIAQSKALPREERLAAAAKAFEAVFLRQILESAQKPLVQSGIVTENSSKAVYRDIVNETLADRIASSGQFGLAGTLLRDWTRQMPAERPAQDGAGASAVSGPVPSLAATPEAAVEAARSRPTQKPFRHPGSSLAGARSQAKSESQRP